MDFFTGWADYDGRLHVYTRQINTWIVGGHNGNDTSDAGEAVGVPDPALFLGSF